MKDARRRAPGMVPALSPCAAQGLAPIAEVQANPPALTCTLIGG